MCFKLTHSQHKYVDFNKNTSFILQYPGHAMSSSSPLSFTVFYRGTPYALSLLHESTLSALQARLEELTQVPASLQKLIHKGKNLLGSGPDSWDQTTLAQAGLKNGVKIQMMGSTSLELTSMQSTEEEQRKRERILRERALKPQVKVCISLAIALFSMKSSFVIT